MTKLKKHSYPIVQAKKAAKRAVETLGAETAYVDLMDEAFELLPFYPLDDELAEVEDAICTELTKLVA
jgi:hypothetical protein